MKDRIGKFQFVKDVDFGIFPKFGGNSGRGRPSAEYWLTATTARMMAADVNSARSVEVIKFLVARHERLAALMGNALADMAATDDGFIKVVSALPASSEVVVDADTGELIPHEVDGFVIHQRAKDGYVNAIAMCKAAGRLIGNWRENIATKKVLTALESRIGIPIRELVIVNMGGTADVKGTWVHPTVALHLANWCSEHFYAEVLTWTINERASGNTPTAPAVDFSDPLTTAKLYIEAEEGKRLALAQLADTRLTLETTSHELVVTKANLDVKEEELGVAVIEKQKEERKAAAMARAVALEAESKILSG